jgi:hypothetical protein
MEDPTASDIETYLREQGGWVSCRWLCAHFEINDRRLRFLGEGFLISRPGGGYIHRDYATPDELEAYCGPEWARAVSILKKIKRLRRQYSDHRIVALAVAKANEGCLL